MVAETTKPSPYLKQLAKHFRHKLDVSSTRARPSFRSRPVVAELRPTPRRARWPSTATPTHRPALSPRSATLSASHLERFGRRDELAVRWSAA